MPIGVHAEACQHRRPVLRKRNRNIWSVAGGNDRGSYDSVLQVHP